MSVLCRTFVGFTVDFATNLKYADFRKCDAFIEQHPELDEYAYNLSKEAEGKLVLICDGMNGRYLRLVQIDQCKYGCNIDDDGNMIELKTPVISDKLLEQFKSLYKEYTGDELDVSNIKYVMWTQWY